MLNLEIKKGELLVIIGVSGLGKSLLVYVIMDIFFKNVFVIGDMIYCG